MRRILRKILRRRRLERELEAEIAFHREMAAAHGHATPFGNTLAVQEQVRDLWHFSTMENVWRDLRYAVRSLRRSPGLVLCALLSLGFGIGVNVAIFSLVTSALLGTPSIVAPDEWVGLRLRGSSRAPRDVVEQLRRSGTFREVVGEREESSVNGDTGTDTRPLYAVDTTTNYFAGLGVIFADSGERVEVEVHWNAVSPRYFEAMAIAFVSGTTFAPREDSAATPVIVNREWTRRYSPGRPAVGRAFRDDGTATLYRVVGVVEGTKSRTLGEDPLPQLYEHLALKGVERSRVQLIAQVAGPPALAVPAIVAALRSVEPAAGVTVEPMAASMAFAMLPSQVGATMLGSLGLRGLGLAAVGLYGVIAYSVTRRRREIGIRMAVGAGRANIVRLVLGEAIWLVGLGAVIGLVAALVLTRPLAAFLVPGVSPADPISYAAVPLALTLTALLASAAPVLRAIHVAPTHALRAE